jgi:2-methylcitrate dehydratase PrpD
MASARIMSTTPIAAHLQELGGWLWPALRDLPPAVVQRAQRLWIDTTGCAVAGLRSEELQRWVAAQERLEAGPVGLPGIPARLSAGAASTTFAMAACWDEACEGLALSHGRPGVPVVAALWPQLAAGTPVTWEQLWRATAAGYEVAARLGAVLRIRPGMHVDGTWGAFGAAVALIALRGGRWEDAQRAIEACATQLPFSLYRPVAQGANLRNLYLGHSAWLGRQAAQAVLAGFAAPHGAVDDFAALALDPAQAGRWPASGEWLILQSYWKRFAAVRHVHYGAAAALRLRESIGDLDAIRAIRLTTYPEALQYCGNRAPATVLAAQFSLSWGVAAALVHGDLSPAEFRPPRFDDARVRRLEPLVEITADASAFAQGRRGAVLQVRCTDRELRIEQAAVSGDAGEEPGVPEVLAKFRDFTADDPALADWSLELLTAAPQARARHPAEGEER